MSYSGSKSPKFFLGDDDSNSSDILNDEKEKKMASAETTTEVVVVEKKVVQEENLLKTVGGSWSMLKNAAKTTTVPAATGMHSSASLAESVGSEKSNAADSFLKYKMQLLEKEKMLREQESIKAQREKDHLKSTSHLDDNKPSPASISSANPISPLSFQQPASNNPLSDLDSNSQFSPQAPPSSSSHQENSQQAKSDLVFESDKNNSNTLTSPSQLQQQPAVVVHADIKRTQSIQEMRDKERRRREEIAGKIDMTEQHKLISQFEQNFAPP